jgi:2-polyprenyl-6-methoxyphenol hydroxylase-like FAD-dependent oxidoreductase
MRPSGRAGRVGDGRGPGGLGTHAVVVGASVAGLLAARVLADQVDRVTVLEQRPPPGPGVSLAPQGRFPHVVLGSGAIELERLLPGFAAELAARGAQVGTPSSGRWWNGGYRATGGPAARERAMTVPLASRGLIETLLRERVAATPGIELGYGVKVAGLAGSARRVTGVRLGTGAEGAGLAADLVVDASGRQSPLVGWLEALGVAPPTVEQVAVDLTYAVTFVEPPAWPLGPGITYAVSQNLPPEWPRFGLALAVEGGRWAVLVGGYHGDRPPVDPDGFRAFAASLPAPDLTQVLAAAPAVGAIHTYRFRSSQRRRFERLRRLPAGLVPLGDTICSFNPLYGQGMSVAALQARALDRLLARYGPRDLPPRAAVRAFARVVDNPWQIAAGADFAYPETTGPRPPGGALVAGYLDRVLAATTADYTVNLAMSRVQHLLAAPSSLFRPPTVVRVLRAASSGRPAVAGVAQPAPPSAHEPAT